MADFLDEFAEEEVTMIGKTIQKKRFLSILLSFVMIMIMLPSAPLTAFAAISDNLCNHHTEHTAECGYLAEQGEASCTYECAECFSNVEDGAPVPEGGGVDAGTENPSSTDNSPICCCTEKCTVENYSEYCEVCAGDYTKCGGSDVPPSTQDYGADATLKVSVQKADPAYTVPTGLTASYGQTLADVALPKADNGTWSWVKAGTTKVGLPGNRTFKAVFTPNDTVNYNTVTVDVIIIVSQTVLTDVQAGGHRARGAGSTTENAG